MESHDHSWTKKRVSAIQVLNALLEVITSVCTILSLIWSSEHCIPINANHILFFAKVNHKLQTISHNSLLHLWEQVIDESHLLKPCVPLNQRAKPCPPSLPSLLWFQLALEPLSQHIYTVFTSVRSATDFLSHLSLCPPKSHSSSWLCLAIHMLRNSKTIPSAEILLMNFRPHIMEQNNNSLESTSVGILTMHRLVGIWSIHSGICTQR